MLITFSLFYVAIMTQFHFARLMVTDPKGVPRLVPFLIFVSTLFLLPFRKVMVREIVGDTHYDFSDEFQGKYYKFSSTEDDL